MNSNITRRATQRRLLERSPFRVLISTSKPKNTQQGAVLLTVIIVMMMIILLIATAHNVMANRIEQAIEAKALIDQKSLVNGKINELAYLAATQRFTIAGLSTGSNSERLVRLDGQWVYRTTGDELRVDGYLYRDEYKGRPISYELQAGNGLIPINTSSTFWLSKWLDSLKIKDSQKQKYIDALHDYIDTDSTARAAGIEHYSDAPTGVPIPTNYFLQDCAELKLIKSWRELVQKDNQLVKECGTEPTSSLNINGLPAPLLAQLWPQKAHRILEKRENGEWFQGIEDLSLIINDLDLNNELLYRFSTNTSLILRVSSKDYTKTIKIEFGIGLQKPFTLQFSNYFTNEQV